MSNFVTSGVPIRITHNIIAIHDQMSMLIIHSQVNDSYCGLLQLSVLGTDCISEALGNGYIVKSYAEFDGPHLKGRIRLVSEYVDPLQIYRST